LSDPIWPRSKGPVSDDCAKRQQAAAPIQVTPTGPYVGLRRHRPRGGDARSRPITWDESRYEAIRHLVAERLGGEAPTGQHTPPQADIDPRCELCRPRARLSALSQLTDNLRQLADRVGCGLWSRRYRQTLCGPLPEPGIRSIQHRRGCQRQPGSCTHRHCRPIPEPGTLQHLQRTRVGAPCCGPITRFRAAGTAGPASAAVGMASPTRKSTTIAKSVLEFIACFP